MIKPTRALLLPRYLTTREAALITGMSLRSMYYRKANGLPYHRGRARQRRPSIPIEHVLRMLHSDAGEHG